MDASLMHNLLKAVFLYGQRYCWGSLTDAPLLRFVFLSVFFSPTVCHLLVHVSVHVCARGNSGGWEWNYSGARMDGCIPLPVSVHGNKPESDAVLYLQPNGVSQYLSIHLSVEWFTSPTCSHYVSA